MPAMIDLPSALTAVLRRPDPAALVGLQEALLASVPAGAVRAEALAAAAAFYDYLLDLEGKLTARQLSDLASWLDVAAMGLVAFENVLSGQATDLSSLLTGLLAEGAMVVASRQHVKAWEAEARIPHDRAAWQLREAFWRLSERTRPGQAAEERLERLRSLVAPAEAATVSSEKILLLGQLFQLLLLIHVSPLLPSSQSASSDAA
ncbi:MAG: hypothetical protein R2844_19435 [Caldilineales bacterium]